MHPDMPPGYIPPNYGFSQASYGPSSSGELEQLRTELARHRKTSRAVLMALADLVDPPEPQVVEVKELPKTADDYLQELIAKGGRSVRVDGATPMMPEEMVAAESAAQGVPFTDEPMRSLRAAGACGLQSVDCVDQGLPF